MIFIFGQLFVGLMVGSGAVRIDLAFASPQAGTNSPAFHSGIDLLSESKAGEFVPA